MRLMSDNDVIGAVGAIRHILATPKWAPFAAEIGVEFVDFAALRLHAASTDREVWLACQAADIVLVTGNRAGREGSLDDMIRDSGGALSLPVLTIANAADLLCNRLVAEAAVESLLDYVERIDSLRGTGRLYIP